MAKRCERKQQKRRSVQKAIGTERKGAVWITKVKAGPHKREGSVPLAFLVREALKLADNRKEVKAALNSGNIMINGVARKDLQFSVGLFDIVGINNGDKKIFYRIVYGRKGRLVPIESADAKNMLKISKVTGKRVVKGGELQITTDDGIVFPGFKKEVKVNDSLLIKHPEKEIVEIIEMKSGNSAYKMGGRNAGKAAKIKEINNGTMKRESLVTLEYGDENVVTTISKIIIVGKGKPMIDIGVEE